MDMIIAFTVSKECLEELFLEKSLSNTCKQLIASKVLGYAMGVGACFSKLPLLVNMFRSRSADGLNIYAVYLETSGYGSLMVYNILMQNAWSVFGDLVITTILHFFIIALIWSWGISGKRIPTTNIVGFLLCVIVYIALVRALPMAHYHYVARFAILANIVSKLPQIVSNFHSRAVGVQSPLTLLSGFIGSAVKLFVNFVETGDALLVGSSLLSMALNLALLIQVVHYSHSAPLLRSVSAGAAAGPLAVGRGDSATTVLGFRSSSNISSKSNSRLKNASVPTVSVLAAGTRKVRGKTVAARTAPSWVALAGAAIGRTEIRKE